VQPIVLDPETDPVRQMANALAGLGGLSAVHIIAHGRPGEIGFTAGRLAFDNILAPGGAGGYRDRDQHRQPDDRPFGGPDPPTAIFYYSRNRKEGGLSSLM
jgi:hypothetical protein